jgi:hypothetical protein
MGGGEAECEARIRCSFTVTVMGKVPDCSFLSLVAAELAVLMLKPAIAAEKYACTVTHMLEQDLPVEGMEIPNTHGVYLSDGGGAAIRNWLRPDGQVRADAIANIYVDKKFWIDRKTGQMFGDFSSESFATHRVVDQGDDKWSFKVLIEGHQNDQGHRHLMYVEVMQYSADPKKPFVGVGMTIGNGVLAGTCVEQ